MMNEPTVSGLASQGMAPLSGIEATESSPLRNRLGRWFTDTASISRSSSIG